MKRTYWTGLAVLLLAAAVWVVVAGMSGSLRPIDGASNSSSRSPIDPLTVPFVLPASDAALQRVEATPDLATAAPSSASVVEPLLAVEGLVLAVDGRAVAGVQVGFCNFDGSESTDVPPAPTDVDGRFKLLRPRRGGILRVVDDTWITVLEPHLYEGDQTHDALTIVVSRSAPIAGVVVESDGRRIAGAAVYAVPDTDTDLRARIARVLDRCVDVSFSATTTDDGSFAIPRAPSAARVLVSAEGYAMVNVPIEGDRSRQWIVLTRARAGDELVGRVVDERIEPVTPARVTIGDTTVRTDASGRFRIALWAVGDPPDGTIPELIAVAPGRVPARARPYGADWRSRAAWPGDLSLRIGGPALRLHGRVVRADGTSVPNPRVSFAPPEPPSIPDFMTDGPVDGSPEQGLDWTEVRIDGSEAARGRFETAPVEPGRYRLSVVDPQSLQEFVTDPIEAGPSVVIRMPDVEVWPPLRGVVVDRRGEPCAGADWLVERSADPATGRSACQGDWHHADDEARIEHPPLHNVFDTLCVKAAGMADWLRFPLASLSRAGDFRVVVPIGCPARVELTSRWSDVEVVALVDALGARSPVVITRGNMAFGTREIHVAAGRSQTFVALDDCVELLLLRGDDVVHRAPVVLLPGQINVLRD